MMFKCNKCSALLHGLLCLRCGYKMRDPTRGFRRLAKMLDKKMPRRSGAPSFARGT